MAYISIFIILAVIILLFYWSGLLKSGSVSAKYSNENVLTNTHSQQPLEQSVSVSPYKVVDCPKPEINLESLIAEWHAKGYEYMRMEVVSEYIPANAGCFGLGATPAGQTTRYLAVFKKPSN